METALCTQWNSSDRPQMHRKSKTTNPAEGIEDLVAPSAEAEAGEACSGTQGTPKILNTFSNSFTQIDHRSTHRCLSHG